MNRHGRSSRLKDMYMKRFVFRCGMLALLVLGLGFESGQAAGLGGLFGRKSEAHKARALHEKVEDAVARFKKKDPGIQRFFDKSVAYVVFPRVVKAGIGFGGAMGKGELFSKGKLLGYSTMTQATVGFQFGGQSYIEIIFFDDEETLREFQNGTLEFGAQVSAVALTVGASDNASFDQGLAVFTLERGGLMYEATLGGQVFTYRPK